MLEAQSGKFLGWCRVMVPGDRGYWMVHEFQLVEKKTLRHSYFRHGEQEKDTIHCVYIYIYFAIFCETATCKAHSECPIPLLRCMSCGRQLGGIIQSSPTCDCIVDLFSGISMFVYTGLVATDKNISK